VSGGGLPEEYKAKVEVTIDFAGVSEDQLHVWATSHLIINVQRVLRTKSTAELNALVDSGYKVKASEAGRARMVIDVQKAFAVAFVNMTADEQTAKLKELETIANAQ